MAAAREAAGAQARWLQDTAFDAEQFENDLIAGGLRLDQATMAAVRHAVDQLDAASAGWDQVTVELGKHGQGEEYAASGHAAGTDFLAPGGSSQARPGEESGAVPAAGHLAVERWPIEKIGALRSGNNPELTVEEEHQLRMAGQGNPYRNDTLRAEHFGFPDARAYQQHTTDSMRARGQVNAVEYRYEYDYANPDGWQAPRVPTMTTGHHRYSGARILGWSHMDIKLQGPYGSQDKPVPGFEGR